MFFFKLQFYLSKLKNVLSDQQDKQVASYHHHVDYNRYDLFVKEQTSCVQETLFFSNFDKRT